LLIFIEAAVGLALLLFAADYVVRGAVGLARRLGVSTLIIGLTVVAFGTSAPEFVTTLTAALRGTPDMAIGNIVGSNIANLLLILGAAAAFRPIVCSPRAIKRDGLMMLGATMLFTLLVLDGWLGYVEGTLLMIGLGAYLALSYLQERRAVEGGTLHEQEVEEVTGVPRRLDVAIGLLLGGLLGLVLGAKLLVAGAAGIAQLAGVSDAVIGLTLVALGTSLPELATVTIAAWRNHGDVAVGNVLGSNIFNLLVIGGGVSLITPLPVAREILVFDAWAMLAVTVLLLPLMITGGRLSRVEGWVLAALYLLYMACQFGPLARLVHGF